MVANTLEKPPIHIDTLDDFKNKLKIELTFEEKNELAKDFKPFEVAHEEVIKVQEKINRQTHEKVKTLRELAQASKETKETSEKAREGLMGNIEQEVEKAKKTVTEKVDEIKDKATGAVKEALSPFENIKDGFGKIGNSITEIWSTITTTLKFGFYSMLAFFGLKGAKEKLAAMAKEKAEKVVEDVKEKAGEIAKTGEEGAKEGKEGIGEKVGPLAVLGTAGLGIFALIKSKLPASMSNKLSEVSGDKKGFLERLAGNRALRLFGVSGVTLFGVGKLSEYIEKNGAELGEMPTDEVGKKEWWKNAIEKAGIGIKDGAEDIWSLLNGEKLDEYLTNKETEDKMEENGYTTLAEHKTIQAAKKEIMLLEKRCEILYNEHKDFFNGSLTAGFILKPGMFAGASFKGTAVMLGLLSHVSPNLIIPAGLVVGLTNNSLEGLGHIRIPNDIGPEDLRDLIDIPDMSAFLESHMPGMLQDIHFETVATEFQTLEQKIKDFNAESFMKNMAKGVAEKLIQTETEKINSTNAQGIKTLIARIEEEEIKSDKKGSHGKLIGKNGVGILVNLAAKLGAHQSLTEGDIRAMMEAAEGTNIRIFPRDSEKSGNTIQYTITDEQGNIVGEPKNICINPTIDHAAQYETAHDFVVNEYDLNTMNILGKTASEFQKKISELTISLKENHEKSGSIIESLFRNGLSIATIGTETFAVDYLGNKYFVGPWNLVQMSWLKITNPEDKLEMQEGLVEYGQSLAPVFMITAAKNFITGHGFSGARKRGLWNALFKNTIVQSITYPAHLIKSIAKGAILGGKYIGVRALSGNYKDIFSDPKNEIKAKFYESIHRVKSLQKFGLTNDLKKIGGLHSKLSKLEEARKLLYAAKQSSFTRSGTITEAMHILESAGSHLQHGAADDLLDDDTLKTRIKELEEEIQEQRDKLAYLERGVRERFPQELQNRNHIVDDLKRGTDITTTEGKKQAQEAFDESQKEIEKMEEKRIQAEKELGDAKKAMEAKPNDSQLRDEYHRRNTAHLQMMNEYRDNHRNLSEVREAMGELLHGRKPKIKLGEGHLQSVKGLRGSVKVLGILAATVGAGFAIEKVAGYIHGDSHEEHSVGQETSESDDKYYGFRKDSGVTKIESGEKNEFRCETPEEFNQRIEAIETQYTESINKFMNPEWVQNVSSEEREKRIQEAADGHMLRVDTIKSLIAANKGMMEGFWNQHFTSDETGEEIVPDNIRKQGVKAFMFIYKKKGVLTLDYMSHQDMKNVFYLLYDQNYKNALESSIIGSSGATAADLAIRVAPFTGSYMDGHDAYKSFSRGNIGDGLWSTAWCVGGLVLDIGGVVSFGGSTAAGSALRAGKIGTKLAAAGLHNGVQMGIQFGQSLSKVPRSESVSIDSL